MQVLIKGNVKINLEPFIVDTLHKIAIKKRITVEEWISNFVEVRKLVGAETIATRIENYCFVQFKKLKVLE